MDGLAAALLDDQGVRVTSGHGRRFHKMSGSGNDFVIFDARKEPAGDLAQPGRIMRMCARATGVGADGVVFLEPASASAFRMSYYNSDGTRASLCGNAALCCTRLIVALGGAPAEGFVFETDAGTMAGRMVGELPEIDLPSAGELREDAGIPLMHGELRMGFALAGVPHLVVLVADVGSVDVLARGSELRRHRSLSHGANVNFVAPMGSGSWAVRTYERGVEGETLACGTGAVAAASVLRRWSGGADTCTLVTRSGEPLTVTLRESASPPVASLRGEGRIVFEGRLGDV